MGVFRDRFTRAATRVVLGIVLSFAVTAPRAQTPPPKVRQSAPKPKRPPAPTTTELRQRIQEQEKRIQEQQAHIDSLAQRSAAQDSTMARLLQEFAALQLRLDELEQQIPSSELTRKLDARLARMEADSLRVPELPPDVVSAGDFPGSIRIPRSDAAIKFGGRVRVAAVFTLGPLGTEDRFLTNSIPVDGSTGDVKGARTNFSARASRFNVDMRSPTAIGETRMFLEGDFFGVENAFRLRHAFAQAGPFLVGQTWSTFSDPSTNVLGLDFEGVSGENVIRQPQIRYSRTIRANLRLAASAETPLVSITGGAGVNVIPDLVGRARKEFGEKRHLQAAVVLRQIRGEAVSPVVAKESVLGIGGSLSGVAIPWFAKSDRFVFQVNGGVGTARYINDLNSLGGQDAVFDSTGHLEALPVLGWYVDYEHQWANWESFGFTNLRSAFIWSYVVVNNATSQPGDAYARTNRFSGNLVLSPANRIDLGVEYIFGSRHNKDGRSGDSSQLQIVMLLVF